MLGFQYMTGGGPQTLNPADGTAAAAGTAKTTTTDQSGFWADTGNIFRDALGTAASFGTSLLQLDLFKRAQDAGVVQTNATTQQTATNQQSTGGSATGAVTSGSKTLFGMPIWAVAGGAGFVLLLLVLLVKR